MKVEYVIVADYAMATDEGRFNAIGAGLRFVAVPQFPHTFPNLSVLVSLMFDEDEVNQHFKLEMTLVGPQGAVVLGPVDWDILPASAAETEGLAVVVATVSGQHVQFAQPGEYTVVVEVNDELQATLPIIAWQEGSNAG
jgi:hypothetical protein